MCGCSKKDEEYSKDDCTSPEAWESFRFFFGQRLESYRFRSVKPFPDKRHLMSLVVITQKKLGPDINCQLRRNEEGDFESFIFDK